MAKKIPIRSCIVCKGKFEKQDLFRIVSDPSDADQLIVDPTGKANGRGAYVCSVDCLSKLLDKDLARSFRKNVPKGTFEKLKNDLLKIEKDLGRNI